MRTALPEQAEFAVLDKWKLASVPDLSKFEKRAYEANGESMPYRILYQNAFERVDVAGERCYLLGVDRDEGLITCPDAPPPRNRVIKLSDPAVHRLGVIESIFTPATGEVGAASPRTP